MYSIGEISKISNISVKTLRFYDQKDIVVPEIRDENTGYRYYSDKQILQLQILRELKPLGFSLDDISSILQYKDIDLLKNKMESKVKSISKDIEKQNYQLAAARSIYNRLTNGVEILSSILEENTSEHKESNYISEYIIPEMWVLSTRYKSKLDAKKLFLERCLELQQIRDKYGLFHSGAFIAVFHDGYESQFNGGEGDLEVLLPVIKPNNFECKELKPFGGMLTASIIHLGHYKDALCTYISLIEWIECKGYQIIGPPMEKYILDPCTSADNSNSYITKISFPIKK